MTHLRQTSRLAAIFLLFLPASSMLFAQNPFKREVFGTIGIGKTYDDEGSLGSGINGGGGIGYRLGRRFGVEAEVNGFRTRRDFAPGFAFRANGALLMGNGLLYLTRSRAQIFLLGGVGLLHIRRQSDFSGHQADISQNGFAVNLGMGAKIFVTPRFALRPELRLFAGDSSRAVETPFTDLRISIGAGYCW